MSFTSSRVVTVLILISVVLLGALFAVYDKIRVYSNYVDFGKRGIEAKDDIKEKITYHAMAAEQVTAGNIEKYLRVLTKIPHVAGTVESKQHAEWVAKKFRDFGLSKVEIKEYKVLLSYPTEPGSVTLLNQDGSDEIKLVSEEKVYNEFENSSRILPPYIAFSKSGTIEGELIYANFGGEDDFEHLKKEGIELENSIALIKLGKFSRQRKLQAAEKYHVKGVILYPDPEQYCPTGRPYPETMFMPGDGTQRGTSLHKRGDPLSRGYPAKDGYHRKNVDSIQYKTMLQILPIGYKHAEILLRKLDGKKAPSKSWKGHLNVPYNMNSKEGRKVRLKIGNKEEDRMIYNVIGTIEGAVEPDRLVLLGNHRDAWAFGAGDPGSGTATMVEIARVMGWLRSKGWKPRRSILFCSWDAEEFGLIGSTEWGEEYANILTQRAVAYINVDSAIQGNYTIEFKATPPLRDVFHDVIKMVKDPEDKAGNLFDSWVKKKGNRTYYQPDNTLFGGSSDYMQFYTILGISSMDLRFEFDPESSWDDQYPVYHSIHDNFDWMKRFLDPDFRFHATLGKLLTLVLLTLADNVLLPFNIKEYGRRVNEEADAVLRRKNEIKSVQDYNFAILREACKRFKQVSSDFYDKLQTIDLKDDLAVRMTNDKLMLVERGFVVTEEIMGERTRHMYHTSELRAVLDDVANEKPGAREELKIKITVFAHHIRMATMILQDKFL